MTAGLFGMVAMPTLGLVLLVFGFAPPLVLRLILLLYPKNHEQRAELMGELRAMPWKDRPIWVAEQLETGLVEGLGARIRDRRNRKAALLTRDGRAVNHGSQSATGPQNSDMNQARIIAVMNGLINAGQAPRLHKKWTQEQVWSAKFSEVDIYISEDHRIRFRMRSDREQEN